MSQPVSRNVTSGLVLNWFLSAKTRSTWDFALERISGNKFLDIPFCGYLVKGSHSGNAAYGLGVGEEPKLALLKAVAEMVERHSLFLGARKSSSNGYAIHTDPKKAEMKARYEIVERHLFLAHFWRRKPFFTPSYPLQKIRWYTMMTQHLQQAGFRLQVWEMQRLQGVRAFVAIISEATSRQRNMQRKKQRNKIKNRKKDKQKTSTKKTFGLVLGAGADANPAKAIQGALGEAFCGWHFFREGRLRPLNVRAFNKVKNPSPQHHTRLGFSPDYIDQVGDYFFHSLPACKNHPRKFNIRRLHVEPIRIPSSGKNGFPFHIFRASDSDLIEIPFGHLSLDEKSAFEKKLMSFWRTKEQIRGHMDLPHPFP